MHAGRVEKGDRGTGGEGVVIDYREWRAGSGRGIDQDIAQGVVRVIGDLRLHMHAGIGARARAIGGRVGRRNVERKGARVGRRATEVGRGKAQSWWAARAQREGVGAAASART